MNDLSTNPEFKKQLNETYTQCSLKFQEVCHNFEREKEVAPTKQKDLSGSNENSVSFDLKERLQIPVSPMMLPKPEVQPNLPNLQALTANDTHQLENTSPKVTR